MVCSGQDTCHISIDLTYTSCENYEEKQQVKKMKPLYWLQLQML